MAAHLALLISLAFKGLVSFRTETISLLTASFISEHTRYSKESRLSHLNSPENLKVLKGADYWAVTHNILVIQKKTSFIFISGRKFVVKMGCFISADLLTTLVEQSLLY